ncbi:tetratricopeptide repeat protein [Deinococcus sp. YIM 134068]|uniref:ATP-binding protein n=1 Tax=Deinococcus lichenicola TaxID=3118910 RepID=UPI002F948981
MLRTLGDLRLEDGPRQQPKLLLLLAYLSLEGPRERTHLHHLFWPHATDPANSLRVAVRRLRAGAPGSLAAEGTRLVSRVPTDALDLLAASGGGHHARVVELYAGRFLEGLELPDPSAELEEWVFHSRELLAARVREARLALGEAAAARGEDATATRHAETAYLLPGAPEPEPEDLRRLYLLLLAGHSPHAAEVRREAERYGLTLPLSAEEARRLLRPEAAPAPSPPSPPAPPAPASRLPTFGTSFVGREAEVRETLRRMLDPVCRLLSVVGLGGMGKTRLAVQAACALQEAGAFADGVCFVNLAPVASPAHLTAAVVEALHLGLEGPEDPARQLARLLAPRHLLLVLDNFEHVIGAAGQLVALLEACPHLKLLVTSRERLNVQEEWVLPLEGLVPLGRRWSEESGDELDDHPALLLFVQRAQRSGRGFALTAHNRDAVLELCRLVHGSPLAIELAATWARVLPVEEIVAELRRSLDFLTDVGGRGPARHASLRVVFEQSWRLLDGAEQGALARLSVFRSPFRREAAARVAGVSLPVLATLTDKSLLLPMSGGRYGRHPLLYEYTAEKLSAHPAEGEAAREAHARFFLGLLAGRGEALAGPGQRAALRELEAEYENLLAAWAWATGHGEFAALRGAARVLRVFFDRSGRYRDGIEVLAGAADHLAGLPNADPVTLGELLIHRAVLHLRLGTPGETGALVERGLGLLDDTANEAVVEGLDVLAVLELRGGRPARAKRYWERALSLTGGREDATTCRLWNMLGTAEQWLGHHRRAEAWYGQALRLGRDLGLVADVNRTLNNLGAMFILTERFGEARGVLEEGLGQARELGLSLVTVHFLNNLAVVFSALGEGSRARDHGEEALTLIRALGDASLEAEVLETLGRVELAEGHLNPAHSLFVQGLGKAWPLRQWPVILPCLEGVAEVMARLGRTGEAGRLLHLVAGHPAAPRQLVLQAERVLETPLPSSPDPDPDAAQFEGHLQASIQLILQPGPPGTVVTP